jgi:hypothetical protein
LSGDPPVLDSIGLTFFIFLHNYWMGLVSWRIRLRLSHRLKRFSCWSPAGPSRLPAAAGVAERHQPRLLQRIGSVAGRRRALVVFPPLRVLQSGTSLVCSSGSSAAVGGHRLL